MKTDNLKKLELAVDNFNSSPWVDLGTPLVFRDVVKRANDIGVEQTLKEINREDIRLFHKEEALSGMI